MFESVRRHQRIFLGVILLLIIPSFVVVGAWDLIAPGGGANTVAKVGKREISLQQWEQSHQQAIEQVRAQLGGRIDPSILDSSASRLSTLNDLVNQQILFAAAVDLKVRVTDEQMRRAIASIPAVQKNGQFDMALYQQALKAQGLTAEGFEQRVRADMLTEILPASIAGTSMAPRSVARRLAQLAAETRTVRVKKFAAADFASAVKAPRPKSFTKLTRHSSRRQKSWTLPSSLLPSRARPIWSSSSRTWSTSSRTPWIPLQRRWGFRFIR